MTWSGAASILTLCSSSLLVERVMVKGVSIRRFLIIEDHVRFDSRVTWRCGLYTQTHTACDPGTVLERIYDRYIHV